eukprot:2256512-Alexandrium_andersonii.AAC.1
MQNGTEHSAARVVTRPRRSRVTPRPACFFGGVRSTAPGLRAARQSSACTLADHAGLSRPEQGLRAPAAS